VGGNHTCGPEKGGLKKVFNAGWWEEGHEVVVISENRRLRGKKIDIWANSKMEKSKNVSKGRVIKSRRGE